MHSPTQDFLNTLYSNYFYPIIHKPTRVTDRSATLIDNILSNCLNKEMHSGILYSDITDHFPIFQFTVLNNNIENQANIKVTYRKYNKRNITRFKQLMKDASREDVYAHGDTNSAYQTFMDSFNLVFNDSIAGNSVLQAVLTNQP